METIFFYFAKVNGLIIMFYLTYVLFLRKETFFSSNRWYLILGLFISIFLPLFTFTKTIWIEPKPIVYEKMEPISTNFETIPIEVSTFDWSLIVLGIYIGIATLVLLKIGFELFSFFNRIQKHNKQKESSYIIVDSNAEENPFSFFSYIVVNKNMYSEEELQHILTHESIHVKQKHSFDVLLGKICCALFWANPIIWLYRKAMLQNLEFIADNETFRQIENKYLYQRTLLKVVTHQHNLSITNQFYQSLIKKRIVMLHKNQSHKKNVWKYATILPLLVGFMLLFQIETVAQVKESKIEENNYAVSANYSSILTKNSTDKELAELEKTFSDEKHKLKISKVKRNKKGEIIEIKLLFDSGKTYVEILERKSTEPIDAIKIFINSDKNENVTCGFEEIKNSSKYGKEVKVKRIQIEDADFPTPPTPPTPPNHPYENIMEAPMPPDFPEVPDLPKNLDDPKAMGKYETLMKKYDLKIKELEPKIKEFEKKIAIYEKEMNLKEPEMKNFEAEMKIFEEKMKVFEKEMEVYQKHIEKSSVEYYINGEKVSKEELELVSPNEIESVNVNKNNSSNRIEIKKTKGKKIK
jgi:beta-lactamase regulating signal transducer with metallopeptidase domain